VSGRVIFLQHAPYLYPHSVSIFITHNCVHDLFDLVLPRRRDTHGPGDRRSVPKQLGEDCPFIRIVQHQLPGCVCNRTLAHKPSPSATLSLQSSAKRSRKPRGNFSVVPKDHNVFGIESLSGIRVIEATCFDVPSVHNDELVMHGRVSAINANVNAGLDECASFECVSLRFSFWSDTIEIRTPLRVADATELFGSAAQKNKGLINRMELR
jgi:hypothetical protein